MDSILNSTKKLLGIAEDYTNFDADIIMHINSVFMILTQLGIGPEEGYSIKSKKEKWDDFVDEDADLNAVKSYVAIKVKMLFDPPLSGNVMNAYNQQINELEWRLNFKADVE